jgi:hypothetical protein
MADFGFQPSLTAGGDVNPFRFVELSTAAEFTGLQANAATDNVIGVTDGSVRRYDASLHAVSGDRINLQPSNCVQVELGTGGTTIGALLVSDSVGRAVVGASTNVSYYQALQSGAIGEIVWAFRIGTRIVP